MHMWRQTIYRIVDKRPSVEESTPVFFCAIKILSDLTYCIGGLHLVGPIDLEQTAFGLEEAIVLAISLIAPRTAGHKVRFVSQAHQSFEESLKSLALRPMIFVLEALFIICVL